MSKEEQVKEIAKAFESELVRKSYRKGDIEGFQGSLHFYPTYFDRIGLEVINPHDRETGAGNNPIYFECVPDKTLGTFALLYVPLVGPEVSEEEAKQDLAEVANGVKEMMTRYGFGAKTSSGYGTATTDPEKARIEPSESDFMQAWLDGWRAGE
jgi:CRISPR-associated protein Cmr2